MRGATGSGSQRLYSFRDILILKVIKRLLDAGISLQQIRTAVQHLRTRGTDDLTRVTLMSDGASVYECTSSDEVIDLLQGGQGVFGIAIGGVWREIEGTLVRAAQRAHRRRASPRTTPPTSSQPAEQPASWAKRCSRACEGAGEAKDRGALGSVPKRSEGLSDPSRNPGALAGTSRWFRDGRRATSSTTGPAQSDLLHHRPGAERPPPGSRA